VLSGYPHLEEAYWFGEGVMPLLAERGLWTHPLHRAAAGDPAERRSERSQVPFAAA
jgi:alkanesulfonate monooxygenase